MRALFGLLLAFVLSTGVHAQQYQLVELNTELDFPWSMAFLPDGDFLVTEKSGYLKRLDAEGEVLARTRVDLPNILSKSQGGLFDILLLPDFSESGRLMLSYACGTPSANTTCLASAIYRDDTLTSITPIFRAQPNRRGAAHYGGRMALLPDNTLVLTLGDGFDYREQAQNPASHIGKIVRLALDGSVPADNPFAGKPNYAAEIYSLGHRNVQGITYDYASGILFSHEHGARGGDELNRISAGNNYGWPITTHGIDYTYARITPYTEFAGMTPPLHHWTPSIAPAGMTLYRGDLFPAWEGNIFVAALASKRLHRLTMDGTRVTAEEVMLGEVDLRLRDVRTGPDGALYVLTDSDRGKLLKIIPAD